MPPRKDPFPGREAAERRSTSGRESDSLPFLRSDATVGARYFAVIVGIALAVIFAALAATLVSETREHRTEIVREVETSADAHLRLLEVWLKERRGDAETLASFSAFRGWVTSGQGEENAATKAHLAGLLDRLREVNRYDGIAVADETGHWTSASGSFGDGDAVAALTGELSRNPARTELLRFFPEKSEPRLFVARRLDPQTRPLWLLIVADPTRFMSALFADSSVSAARPEILLLQRDRQQLLRLRSSPDGSRISADFVPLDGRSFESKLAFPSTPSSAIVEDERGVRMVVATRPANFGAWTLVARAEESAMLAEWRRQARDEVAGGVLLALGLAVLAWTVHRGSVARHHAFFKAAIMEANDPIALVDPETGFVIEANRKAQELYGWTVEQARGVLRVTDLRPPEERAGLDEALSRARESGVVVRTKHLTKSGEIIPVEVSNRLVPFGRKSVFLAIVRDLRATAAAERKIEELNRLLETLLEVGRLIARERDEEKLFGEACRILVERTGFPLAWIGRKDPGSARVVPIATAGLAADYLAEVEIRADDSPLGRGPTGRVIRGSDAIVVQDIEEEALLAPWLPGARTHRLRSGGSFPIRRNGETVAALTVYSTEPGAIDPVRAELLSDLAEDLGFALEARQTEQALVESESHFRLLFDDAAIPMAIATPEGNLVQTNAAFRRLLGWSEGELAQKTFVDITHPDDLAISRESVRRLLAGEAPEDRMEKRYIARDGTAIWCEATGRLVRDPEGRPLYFLGQIQDITARKAAERALSESERHFRSVFDDATIAMAVGALEGRYLRTNAALQHLLGYSERELSGLSAGEVTHPDDRAETQRLKREILDGKRRYFRLEKRYVTKDQRTVWCDTSVVLVRTAEGVPLHFIVQQQDITARKTVEQALDESQRYFRSSFDDALIASAVTSPDARIVRVNPAFTLLLGYAEDEVRGKTFLDFTYPDDVEASRRQRDALVSGDIQRFHLEKRYMTRDGRILWCEVSSRRVRDAAGEPLFNLTQIVDISARKLAEEALQESERYFRSTFADAAIASAVISPDGKIVRANEATTRLLGWDEAELRGRDIQDIIHPENQAESARLLGAALRGDMERFRIEKRYLTKGGGANWCDASARLVRGNDGKPLFFLLQIQDISARRAAEEEIRRANADLELRVQSRTADLEASNRELEAFTYSVSHDLRAPLRAIDGFARMLEEDRGSSLDEEGHRLLGVVRASAAKMAHLIDGLLNLSRATRKELRPTSTDMRHLVATSWQSLAPPGGPPGVEFVLGKLPEAVADPALIREVWLHLLENAVKFSAGAAHPRVEVDAEPGERAITFRVRDNGVGFDPRFREKLFRVFQRLHGVDEFPGSGVGLAIVRRLVERHGGTVHAEGEPGKGATISFTLPARRSAS